MKTVDWDDYENWFGCGHDDADDVDGDDEVIPIYLHSGKIQIPNRYQLAEAGQIIFDRTVAASGATLMSPLMELGRCPSKSSIMQTVSSEGGTRTDKGVETTSPIHF